jgi:peptide/nickel transport system substrate-binding protein
MKRIIWIVLAILLIATLLMTGCRSAQTNAGPLIVLIDNDEGPITPANFNTFIGFWMVGWVYDPLFVLSPDLQPIPALATEAKTSPDGLTWDISLRQGVKWHDGQPFTSKDVVFAYQFLVAAGRAQALTVIDTITANGDYGVTLKLKKTSPFFLHEGLSQFYIMPEHIWKDQKPGAKELSQFQGKIGTGPYKLVEVVPGESYTFAANNDYYRGKPRVEKLIAKTVKDRTQQVNQLRSGAAGAVIVAVPPAQVGELEGDKDVKLIKGSDLVNYNLYLNGSRAPFNDIKVRQAIAMAIDKEALVKTVLQGRGTALPASFYHPDLPYASNIPAKFDPKAARALLDEAGLKDSNNDGVREMGGKPAEFEIMTDVNNPVEVRAAELIIGWLKDVGITAKQKAQDIDTTISFIWPQFSSVPDPKYDMATFLWSNGPQIQRGFLRALVDGQFGGVGWANLTGMADAELDKLEAEYVTNPDPNRQKELNTAIQKRFAEVAPFIPLFSPSGNFAYHPKAYDGWVYMKGTGIMTAWSFLPPDAAKAK